MGFRLFCEQQGIELLREDIGFIRDMLSRIPKVTHKSILNRYTCEWLGAADGEILLQHRSGAQIWMKDDGSIVVSAATQITVSAEVATLNIPAATLNGNLIVNGGITQE